MSLSQAAGMWMTRLASATRFTSRALAGQDQSPCVPLPFGRVPVLKISRRVQRALRFDLLAAENIRRCPRQKPQKALTAAGGQAVQVPRYQFHTISFLLRENIYSYYLYCIIKPAYFARQQGRRLPSVHRIKRNG